MAMIEIKNISKWYGNFQVLKDCSVDVEKGEVVVVCGPSGSGKSTLIKTVNALEPFQKGEIIVDGISVGDPKTNLPQLRSRVGMVFQHFELFPHLSIRENLVLAQMKVLGRGREEATERGLKLLDRVGLLKHADKFPGQMSGGQQQRVALARAIVIEPAILLMDEPLSNLDAKLRVEMRNAIKRIQQQIGITTVYVTHDQEEALAVSDRIAVMNGGIIQQIDTPARVYQRPANQFVANFIGLSNFLPASVSRKGEELSILFPEGGYRVGMTNLRPDLEDGTQVLVAVRPEEFEMRSTELEGIPAVVRSSIFLGNTTHYFLELGDGSEVEAIQDSDVWEIIPNGTAVRLGVKEKKINVFSRDGSTSLVVREELL